MKINWRLFINNHYYEKNLKLMSSIGDNFNVWAVYHFNNDKKLLLGVSRGIVIE